MVSVQSSEVTKKLLLRCIQENIEFKKRSSYLQEIILMSRKNKLLVRLLETFLSCPMHTPSYKEFSNN